jgi:hypothetical protein
MTSWEVQPRCIKLKVTLLFLLRPHKGPSRARKITATIKVGKGPDGIAIDTAMHTVYTVYTANTGDGTVSVISTT